MKLMKAFVVVSMLFSVVPGLSAVSLASLVRELGGAAEYNKVGLACDKANKIVVAKTNATTPSANDQSGKAVLAR